jgi:hypothetical protein
LRALAQPVVNTFTVYTQALFLTTGYRVEETNTLDKTPITGITAVSYGNMIKRALLRTAT